ncbi:GNAT family N-acetyltransferase [Salinicoccus sesuvii]|uniref:GNAT family N-acetyltransferase n=1 Tax=Salinicoccus sesuvii TaxID=868281 RepID=A0ABV7N4X6_9STAP
MNTYLKLSDISLRPLYHSDFPNVLKWTKDKAFCHANGWALDRSEVELRQWWSNQVDNRDKTFSRKGIEVKGKLIGYIDIALLDKDIAELGIAIGERMLWGKGIGPKVVRHAMDIAHKDLGIITFNAETHEKNTRARNMLKKLDFKEIDSDESEEQFGPSNGTIMYQLKLEETTE